MDVPSLPRRTAEEQREKERGRERREREEGREREREGAFFRSFTSPSRPTALNPPSFLLILSRSYKVAEASDLFRSIRPISFVPGSSGRPTGFEDLVNRSPRWRTSERRKHVRVCARARCHDRIKPSAISFDSISRVRRIYIGGGKLR